MSRTNSTVPDRATTGMHIERLVAFALKNGLIDSMDLEFSRNSLLDLFGLTEPVTGYSADLDALPDSPVPLLEPLLDIAAAQGLIEDHLAAYRDLFDSRLMGLLMPRPSETNRIFREKVESSGVTGATDWFYKMNIVVNYIREDRNRKNGYWRHATPFGELEITINLAKPEKDPKEIALLKSMPQANYPPCLLCRDNVGYAGRLDHPARQNLRILPLTLHGEPWFFQYSPYAYYNEHSILLKGEHTPMVISPATFVRLLDFVDQFPHYFIGSNADLPIVGGSILNHDHFQAGRHVFPMEKADALDWNACAAEPSVSIGRVEWPMSVLRMRAADRHALLRAATYILASWRAYSDPDADVLAFSANGSERVPHNTITPIARRREDGSYELDLVLRNNRTSEEHPAGIFHPHQELHHIKRENIGLIEVMGLAVLPGRLKGELAQIADLLTGVAPYDASMLRSPSHPLNLHADWIGELVARHGTANEAEDARRLLEAAVGDKFAAVLRDAGVYKTDAAGREAFKRFLTKTSII
ncbi:UDP-glucose--hexose-1-phosphate uridylyltransferase [Cohnella panacarvi]|uniref:UDP-glucose--hexose-1-phosphate uridylyltransferase n=1 Tax=Cohnella panacarvi TaxID=400776 RepID=UPI00047CFA6A|nr:UDP-glucose--hexose-1-phosphate uridylyltransferase [Cohnella panacarvi]